MGTTLRRIGVAIVLACLCVTVGAVSDAAPLQVQGFVSWSIETAPTCPSLHGRSINGRTGSFFIGVDTGTVTANVNAGDDYVLDLLGEDPGSGSHTVAVLEIDGDEPVARWQDVQVFCSGATTPFAPRRGVATPGNGSATVSWLAPLFNGGAPIQYYDVKADDGNVVRTSRAYGATTTTATFTSLTNGVEYRFELQAYNDLGYSPVSKVERSITAGTPTAPTIGTAVPGIGAATVSWAPPLTDNGSPVVAYVVTVYEGYNPVVSVLAGPGATGRTIAGLTQGTTYEFRVRPHNAWGAGVFSAASNPVTLAA